MKHIKTFENKGDIFWVFSYISYEDSSSNYIELFDDEESAINHAIINANETKELFNDSELSDDEYILTYDDFEDWLSEQVGFWMNIYSIENNGKVELPEKIKILRDSRKYNL